MPAGHQAAWQSRSTQYMSSVRQIAGLVAAADSLANGQAVHSGARELVSEVPSHVDTCIASTEGNHEHPICILPQPHVL